MTASSAWRAGLLCVCFVHCSGLLSHVERYEVVRPHRRAVRHGRSVQDHQLFPDTVRYDLFIEGKNHTIHLEKNKGLMGPSYTETRYREDGERVTSAPSEDQHCYYHGHVVGVADSAVSVAICSGLSGVLRARRHVFLIEPLGRSEDADHAVYRREHLKVAGAARCGSNKTRVQDQDQDPQLSGLFKSTSWRSRPAAGPQRFVEVFVVVDHTEFKIFGAETKTRILGVMNHVDQLYRPLNIRVLLVGLEVWTQRDLIHVDIDSETTLDNFLSWRRSDLLKRKTHDNAQFVTGKNFDGDTVGLANKYAMCTENSGGVNQDHHDNAVGLASTIAHEMGHNFGLSHDTAGCMCGPSHSSGNCVMADKLRTGSQVFPEFFSSCSVDQLAEFLARARPACLTPPGSPGTIGEAQRCGDALLDPGEECDCGGEEECTNPCCDAATCRLTEGSYCAHGACCHACQLKPSGTECRPSARHCDLPEFCTGSSPACPPDSFQMNGQPCYNQAEGYCHDGDCPTHQQHCWRLFGAGARPAPDRCFELNRRAEEGANCGRTPDGFASCAPANLKCGSMFCDSGGESITGKRAAYTLFSTTCRLAVDDDKTRNIDMVPNGTKCGPEKVCLNHRCVDVGVYGRKDECAKKCNNNGVCNHKKECHCNPGWAPPYCDVQYGDLPPGPSGIIASVCAALSVLLVVTTLVAGLMCCRKDGGGEDDSAKRKVRCGPAQLGSRPHISLPTFMASTATQACTPLVVTVTPSRPPPQSTPGPPSKPLPPLSKPQVTPAQHKAVEPGPSPAPPVRPAHPPPASPAARIRPSPPPVPPAKPRPHRST